ncbi:hypothetical protein SO802_010000 [Lithocarpus litseifolius]|uniref:Uncharacterized protein n=1 Tax=Lithocarpus litseifolius TaxID=425828 RepID=A0AAW2DFZ1_9ROSI
MWDETHTPIIDVLRVEAMARPMGPGFEAQNSFSPLSGLGSEKGLCFGRRDDSMVVSGEKGEIMSNPIAEPVSPSHLDGVELPQVGPEHLLIQWKHSEVNRSGFFHGEEENDFFGVSTSI